MYFLIFFFYKYYDAIARGIEWYRLSSDIRQIPTSLRAHLRLQLQCRIAQGRTARNRYSIVRLSRIRLFLISECGTFGARYWPTQPSLCLRIATVRESRRVERKTASPSRRRVAFLTRDAWMHCVAALARETPQYRLTASTLRQAFHLVPPPPATILPNDLDAIPHFRWTVHNSVSVFALEDLSFNYLHVQDCHVHRYPFYR